MSTHVERLEKKCPICGANMQRVWVKNMWIDDYQDECSKRCDGYDAEAQLSRSSARVARAEYMAENDGGDAA